MNYEDDSPHSEYYVIFHIIRGATVHNINQRLQLSRERNWNGAFGDALTGSLAYTTKR